MTMTFDTYQWNARKSAFYPDKTNMSVGLMYNALKMSGEVGEFNDKLGKCISNNNGIIDVELRETLIKELGDILWHLTSCAAELKTSIGYIAEKNLEKLEDRMNRNTLSGDGDNR